MCSTVSEAVEAVLAVAGGVDEEILLLDEVIAQAEAKLVERVGAFDASEAWRADGAYSFACWLRARTDMTRTGSLRLGKFAGRLRAMPVTEAAVQAGKLSVTKARLLAAVINERTEELFLEQEAFLVDQVQGLSSDDAKVALGYWKRLADQSGPDPSDPTRNWARVSQGFDGRWHLEGNLDQVSGAVLKATLDAITDRLHHDGRFVHLEGSENTASRRCAEAVVEMCHRSTGRNPDQPAVHPDIIVVVPLHALTDEGLTRSTRQRSSTQARSAYRTCCGSCSSAPACRHSPSMMPGGRSTWAANGASEAVTSGSSAWSATEAVSSQAVIGLRCGPSFTTGSGGSGTTAPPT